MNKLLIFVALLALISCADPNYDRKPPQVHKVVKGKNQAQETSYGYQFDPINGKMRQQPNIHTVYYIVFTDGTYLPVDVGKYTVTNIGDTLTVTGTFN